MRSLYRLICRIFTRKPVPLLPSAIAAASWWAGYIRADQNGFYFSDDSPAGGYAALMAAQARPTTSPTDNHVDLFQFYLATYISAELTRQAKLARKRGYGDLVPHVELGVDYGPEGMLRAALVAADAFAHSVSLPTKSAMLVETGKIRVMPGYQAPWEDVPIAH